MKAHIHAPKDETVAADQASGVSREQAEMFNQSTLCPLSLMTATKGGAV